VIAWQAMVASAGYLTATSMQGLVINSQSDYAAHRWHGTLMIFALMLVALLFNTFLAKQLPLIENFILWAHILGFVIVLVTVIVLAPQKSSSKDVWAQFLNQGGYESKGLSFFVGLITPVFAFSGADGAVHMCEEIKASSSTLPWAMMGKCANENLQFFWTLFWAFH
jgi:choline transport protein